MAGAIACVIVVAFVASWYGAKGPGAGTGQQARVDGPLEFKSAAPPSALERLKSNPAPIAPASLNPSSVPAALAVTNSAAGWEEKVDQILTSDGEDTNKASQMLEMFPRLPEDGKVEVAQHLSNLTPDQDYASLRKLLTDASLPESVLDVLLADALNRPNSLKLPSLLDVARDPQNPKAEEAKQVLQLFLDEDYGTDWTTWQAKMDAWLKDNPD